MSGSGGGLVQLGLQSKEQDTWDGEGYFWDVGKCGSLEICQLSFCWDQLAILGLRIFPSALFLSFSLINRQDIRVTLNLFDLHP